MEAFWRAMKATLRDAPAPGGKRYLRWLLDEIRVQGKAAVLRGCYAAWAHAVRTLGLDAIGASAWRPERFASCHGISTSFPKTARASRRLCASAHSARGSVRSITGWRLPRAKRRTTSNRSAFRPRNAPRMAMDFEKR